MITPKERMLAAFRKEEVDRVPISPDISNMVPCRLTGKPFWEIYLNRDPPLGEAYMAAVKKYQLEAWYIYGGIEGKRVGRKQPTKKDKVDIGWLTPDWTITEADWRCKIVEETYERKVVSATAETPFGNLQMSITYPRNSPPWLTEPPVKNLEKDWPKVRYLLGEEWEWEPKKRDDIVGDFGVYAINVQLPVDWWYGWRGLEGAVTDLYFHPKLMSEILEYYRKYALEYAKACIEAEPDEICLQGSVSSNTIISPTIFEKVNLPLIKEITRLCKRQDMTSHLHVCGRSRHNVELLYNYTDLDVIEPLERPPGGDVDLGEAKRRWGDKFCLKGNVNTFRTMISKDPRDVEAEVLECLLAAADGGGYVLSTGDQVPYEVPEVNLTRFVETGKKYGRYPINKGRTRDRLKSIGR